MREHALANGSKKRADENKSRKLLIKKDLTGDTPAQNQPVSPSARQPVSPSARQPVSPSARQPVSFGGTGKNGALMGAVHLGGQLPRQRGQNLRIRKHYLPQSPSFSAAHGSGGQ